jgi:hypothetical protein
MAAKSGPSLSKGSRAEKPSQQRFTAMKIFGRIEALHEEDGLAVLSEVTFEASPIELRRIAAFLHIQADEMAKSGDDYGHRHLQDDEREWFKKESLPDVIVARPPSGRRGD